MYILGYHVSINRRAGLVLPDQGIITEKLNSQKKQKPQEKSKSHETRAAFAAYGQQWFSSRTGGSSSSACHSWPVFDVDLRFAGGTVQDKPRRSSPSYLQSPPD